MTIVTTPVPFTTVEEPPLPPREALVATLPALADEADESAARVRRLRLGAVAAVLGLFFVLIPLLNLAGAVPDYKVNFLGKYLCLAIVALGIDLIWGYTGLLSLCQAMFFCVGGYAVAMHLSLPEGGGIYDVPQFLSYVYYGHADPLPPFWKPFRSLTFAVSAGLVLPAVLASVLGFFIFRSRVRGVYFSIITQAIAWGAWLLISRHEMLLGGTNGLTNFSKALSQQRKWIVGFYLLTLVVLVGAYLLCTLIVKSRLGRVLVAVRDRETRLYFAGYRPYAFKVFAFAVGAVLAAVGGMLYAPQVTIITPQHMDVPASITMVVWVALGGRGRLWGAIFGSLVVNYLYSSLTSDLPSVWPFLLGGIFVGVVLLFPDGFVGLWDRVEKQAAAGASPLAVAIAALPLVALGGFVLVEAVGLMPAFLQRPAIRGVPWKYEVLVVLLLIPVIAHYAARRRPQVAAAGFPVITPGGEALP